MTYEQAEKLALSIAKREFKRLWADSGCHESHDAVQSLLTAERFLKMIGHDWTFGVESVSVDDTHLYYLNTGDTYRSTVAWDSEDGFLITSWGDWFEAAEQAYAEATDQCRCAYCGEWTSNDTPGDSSLVRCDCDQFVDGTEFTAKELLSRACVGEFGEFFEGYLQALGFTARERSEDSEALFSGSGEFDDSWDVRQEIEDVIGDAEAVELVIDAYDFFNGDARELIGDELDDIRQAGVDFHFTRNGHGAGFWDGDWPEHGDKLTELSKPYGTKELSGDWDENEETLVEVYVDC